VKTYNSKNLVEDDFKLLNDQLLVPVGPVYHHKDENIRVNVFLAMIGYYSTDIAVESLLL
jgi:transposase